MRRPWQLLSTGIAALGAVAAWGQSGGGADASLVRYADPSHAVSLADGRKLHLVCMGRGAPTVVLTAGMGDWSETWSKVQSRIATRTRVCAWDRPGFGFSSASAVPQNVLATTADLEAALSRAREHGPYVLVGHSLGGYESLLFADRNRRAVRGMVLVDPSIPGQWQMAQASLPTFYAAIAPFLESQPKTMRACAGDLRAGNSTSGSPDPRGCLRYPDRMPASVAASLARLDSAPERFDTQASLFESFVANGKLAVDTRRSYGRMPLYVLTAVVAPPLPPGMTPLVQAQAAQFHRMIGNGHARLSGLSTRGRHQFVAGAGHYIHRDKPDVVIKAIDDVVSAVRQLPL